MFRELTTEASSVLEQQFGLKDASVSWSVPRDLSHGDAATSVALQIAKTLSKKPQEIAQTLVDHLKKLSSVAKAEVAGAGYVNVWLTTEALIEEVSESVDACEPKKVNKKDKPVIVEYSQPNIAKPLGIHHILSTVIGQALSNVYEHDGFNVLRWNYLGDWGTQFGKLAVAYEKWGDASKPVSAYTVDDLLDLYVKFHTEAEKDESLEDQGRAAFKKMEEGDSVLRKFRDDVLAITKASLTDLYDELHVSFDTDIGESFYEDKMDAIIEEGKKKGVFTEGEKGALIVNFPEETGFPPYMILKGDGATLYSTRDLAQMRYRMDTYDPQEILILTDIAQQLHFQQLQETCKMLGWDLPKFENVTFGRMRFADKSMSTRKGNILKLEHVLDEAVRRADEVIESHKDTIQTDDRNELADMMGVGALVYGVLSQNRKMDMVFDWDKMLSFEGNSAPYLQYTHARAKSVLRKSDTEAADVPAPIAKLTDSERQLLRTLLLFPDALCEARETRMPHKLANFLYQLCQDFNSFYNNEPILKAEEPVRGFRLALTKMAAKILKTGAELLTMRVPEAM